MRSLPSGPRSTRWSEPTPGERAISPRAIVSGLTIVSARTVPPFRADHVGSFLRPLEVVRARERFEGGGISAGDLRAVEDSAIREVVAMQEAVGLQAATD